MLTKPSIAFNSTFITGDILTPAKECLSAEEFVIVDV
jgi:hypothetical protein